MTVKRLQQENGIVRLVGENPDYPPIDQGNICEIWGVVTSVIHSL